MAILAILRPSTSLLKVAEEAIKKFSGIYEIKVEIDSAKTAIELAKSVDQGRRYNAIIMDQDLEEVEINYLLNFYHDLKKKPPLLLSRSNYEKLVKRLSGATMTPVFKDFNRDFIFDYLKETIITSEKKIDIRIIKEVLLSVTNIIFENTQLKLDAKGLSEIKAKDSQQEMSSIFAFIGDGVMGTLTIATSNQLVSLFCHKMLFCDLEQVTAEMRTDVLNELSNQILGAFRNKLLKDGYELSTSMQIVVSGEKPHFFQTKTNGHYYYLEFQHEKEAFLITFAYGSYQKQKGEPNFSRSQLNGKSLDVRLVNWVIRALGEVFTVNGIKPEKIDIREQKGQDYSAESLHLLHGRGHQGSFIIALDLPKKTIGLITEETMGITTENLSPDIVNDLAGELINQITGTFKKFLSPLGFEFLNVFHGSFCATEKIHYLLKNQGMYCRIGFQIKGLDFILCFGMESAQIAPLFDLWPYVKSQGEVLNKAPSSA